MSFTGPQTLTDSITDRLIERYGVNDTDHLAVDTNQKLADRIRNEANALGKNIINHIPSQFDHQNPDDIEVIPQYQFPAWKTLGSNFEFFALKGGVMWLQPAAWQFAWPFHHIARAHKLFVAYGDIYNIPVAVEVSRQAKISCLVTNEEAAKKFKDELGSVGSLESLSLAIVARDIRVASAAPAEVGFKGVTTLWEIQLFPGHTIAYQSFSLAGETNSFHLSEDYWWRFESDATYITGISPEVLPVLNYRLPVVVKPVNSVSALPAFTFNYV